MLLEKWYPWPWALKSAAETWGWWQPLPLCTLERLPEDYGWKWRANKSECIIIPISICIPDTSSSASCSPPCLSLCPTKTTFKALVGSALHIDPSVFSPMLAHLPLHWQFTVEMLPWDMAEKSESFCRVRVETENSLGKSLLSFEITRISSSAAPLLLSVLHPYFFQRY